MRLLLFLLLFMPFLNPKVSFNHSDFKGLFPIIGHWEMKQAKGILAEEWWKVNDSLLQNKSYRVMGKDTVKEESVQLQYSNGQITYNATVYGQNNGNTVPFTLISTKNNHFVFENKEHDFPQQ